MQGAAILIEYSYNKSNLQSEAFQKKEQGEPIQEVSFNISDKALRIQEAKSKVRQFQIIITVR